MNAPVKGETLSHDTRKQLVDAMVKFWGLTSDQGDIVSTICNDDEMVGSLFSVRCLLQSLFRSQENENKWLRYPNAGLAEMSPIDVILTGDKDGVCKVRELVEYLCGM